MRWEDPIQIEDAHECAPWCRYGSPAARLFAPIGVADKATGHSDIRISGHRIEHLSQGISRNDTIRVEQQEVLAPTLS